MHHALRITDCMLVDVEADEKGTEERMRSGWLHVDYMLKWMITKHDLVGEERKMYRLSRNNLLLLASR